METWLRCTISEGQFSDEYAVSGRTADGTGFSLFAPEEAVDFEESPVGSRSVEGWLRVDVWEQKGELCLVRLPRQALENGQYLTVKRDQLQARRQPQGA